MNYLRAMKSACAWEWPLELTMYETNLFYGNSRIRVAIKTELLYHPIFCSREVNFGDEITGDPVKQNNIGLVAEVPLPGKAPTVNLKEATFKPVYMIILQLI